MACIIDYLDSKLKKSGSCSCPECHQTFKPCPTPCRNTMLAGAVEQLRLGNLSLTAHKPICKARRAANSASRHGARERKAVMKRLPASSVPCMATVRAYCESHMKPSDAGQAKEPQAHHSHRRPDAEDLPRAQVPARVLLSLMPGLYLLPVHEQPAQSFLVCS
ncbi:tripartite motif-containing protein 16 isoform X1 [Tachysurus ichikawai]